MAPRYLFASPSDAALMVAVLQAGSGGRSSSSAWTPMQDPNKLAATRVWPLVARAAPALLLRRLRSSGTHVVWPWEAFRPLDMLGGNQAGWEAELWPNASDRNAMTAAAHPADHELGEDAQDEGSELSEGLRSLFAPPLKAIFTVRQDNRIAEVLRIRST